MYRIARLPLLAALCALAACNVVVGSGRIETQSREVTAFTKVEVSHAIDATITTGPASLALTTDDNLLEYVETRVEGGVLKIGVKEDDWGVVSLHPTRGLRARIVAPELVGVAASGASKVLAQATAAERFEAEASGASRIEVSGLVSPEVAAVASGASELVFTGAGEQLDLELSGSSTAGLTGLEVDAAKVALSGASSAEIAAAKSVAGELSGASHLKVHGQPAERDVALSGSSSADYQ